MHFFAAVVLWHCCTAQLSCMFCKTACLPHIPTTQTRPAILCWEPLLVFSVEPQKPSCLGKLGMPSLYWAKAIPPKEAVAGFHFVFSSPKAIEASTFCRKSHKWREARVPRPKGSNSDYINISDNRRLLKRWLWGKWTRSLEGGKTYVTGTYGFRNLCVIS